MISELNLTNNDLDKTQFIFTILDIRMSSYKSCLIDTYYKKLTTKQLFFLIRLYLCYWFDYFGYLTDIIIIWFQGFQSKTLYIM